MDAISGVITIEPLSVAASEPHPSLSPSRLLESGPTRRRCRDEDVIDSYVARLCEVIRENRPCTTECICGVYNDATALELGDALLQSHNTCISTLLITVSSRVTLSGASRLLQYVQNSPHLRTFTISRRETVGNTAVMDQFLRAAAHNRSLQALCLKSSVFGATAFSALLRETTALEELSVAGFSEFSLKEQEIIVQSFRHNVTLQRISLQDSTHSDLNAHITRALATHLRLQSLILPRLDSHLAGSIRHLLLEAPTVRLQELVFVKSHLTEGLLEPIIEGLESNLTLRVLEFRDCKIGREAGLLLQKLLIITKTIATVRMLGFDVIEPETLVIFLEGLKHNGSIQELHFDLQVHRFEVFRSRACVQAVHDLLVFNTALRKLVIHHTDLNDESVAVLALGLGHNRHLMHLDLSATNIDEAGVHAIMLALSCEASSSSIQSLVLARNFLTNASTGFVAIMLRRNKSLREFQTGGMTYVGFAMILEALSQNSTLLSFTVNYVYTTTHEDADLHHGPPAIASLEDGCKSIATHVASMKGLRKLSFTWAGTALTDALAMDLLSGFEGNLHLYEITVNGTKDEAKTNALLSGYGSRNKTFSMLKEVATHSCNEGSRLYLLPRLIQSSLPHSRFGPTLVYESLRHRADLIATQHGYDGAAVVSDMEFQTML